MNKMFAIIGGSLLTIVLVIVLVLVNKPAQSTGVMSTAQVTLTSTHIPMPTLIQTDFLNSSPAIAGTSLPSLEYMKYVVAPNDTCEIIAANFNVSIEDILEKNDLSPSCVLTKEQILLLPLSTSPVRLYEVSNNPPTDFFSEWVNVDLATANMARVSIQMKDGEAHINMFGVCQPTDCNFLEYSPIPTVDFNYDAKSGILNVMWIFDFATLVQELTITSDGQLKVITQNSYLDNSGRLDFQTVEYFTRQ